MTRGPDFDELVGAEIPPEERDRLRRVHELLLEAGPPPELSPEVERGPTLAMTLGRRPRRLRPRALLLAAALVVVALAFWGGYVAGNGGGHGLSSGTVLKLAGTKAAPGALASLRVEPADEAGNWPMELSVEGLPKLPPRGYYEVYLVRTHGSWAPCGSFVAAGAASGTTVTLNSPYRVRAGDTWVVTREGPGRREPGTVVLRPTV